MPLYGTCFKMARIQAEEQIKYLQEIDSITDLSCDMFDCYLLLETNHNFETVQPKIGYIIKNEFLWIFIDISPEFDVAITFPKVRDLIEYNNNAA